MAIVTPDQIRMARRVCRWTMADLGKYAGVARNTVNYIEYIEKGERRDTLVGTLLKLQTALEKAGVTFVDDDGRGPGVRYRPVRPTQ